MFVIRVQSINLCSKAWQSETRSAQLSRINQYIHVGKCIKSLYTYM